MKHLLTAYFIIRMMLCGCSSINTTTAASSSREFQVAKATVELTFITKNTDQLQVLMDAIEKDLEISAEFSEWNQKFSKDVKINAIETYLEKGHQGL
jgi:uncharacterized protein YceK